MPTSSTARKAAGPDRQQERAPSPLPAITLPTGGGAIRGIDEKFAVNPSSGTGSLRVPIAVSPARQGFAPLLALSYNSGDGSGPFGLGWSLALPAITRKTDKGVPTYQDGEEADVFLLSEAEDLVPVLDESGGAPTRHRQQRSVDGVPYLIQRYRPRIDGLFARVERWTDQRTGATHWRSISRDNVTTLYGRGDESRIADPDNPRRVFSWLICESYDDRGNAILYSYKAEDSAGVDRTQTHERNRSEQSRASNRYLKRVRYGNQTPRRPGESLSERDDWLFDVLLDYGEGHVQHLEAGDEGDALATVSLAERQPWPARPDATSHYRAGFELRTYRLCRRILMLHHFPHELGSDDYLVRATHFSYHETPANSVLESITQAAYLRQDNGAYQERALPPLEFAYSQAAIQREVHTLDQRSLEHLPAGLSGAHQWVDLDGEGLAGILSEQAGAWFYKANLGQGRFAPLEAIAPLPSLAAPHEGQLLVDLAGDGQLDLVTFAGAAPGFFERTADRSWASHRAFSSAPPLDWSDPNLRLVDLTGDGRADLLLGDEHAFTWYPSLGEEGFGPSRRASQASDDESGPRLIFSDATRSIYLADMSGDGLADLVRIENGRVCYWPNLGYGRFGPSVTMDQAPWLDAPDLFDQRRVRLADVDGSGIADLLYIHHDRVAVYANQAGNSWAAPQLIEQLPTIDQLAEVAVVDLFGNGTACLVWSSPLPGDTGRQMRYVDLMGGQKPHLLTGSRNNLGAETRVQYAPSTRFYLEDKAAGRPWITRLPFPVHVVERVETFDHVSRNRFVSRYSYHHGYFDGAEREFRGFGMVEQLDTEEFAALGHDDNIPTGANIAASSHVPPVLTRSWFHTGAHLEGGRVSRFFAGLLDGEDRGEYYREPGLSDAEAAARLLPDTVLPPGLSADEEREACRALKGAPLRQEVYALDGTARAEHPYTVVEQNFTVRVLQARGPNRHAVFFTHARETLSYHYERDPDDPRVSHSCALAADDFGNVLRSAALGYGRRQPDATLAAADRERQGQLLMTCAENDFTNPIEEDDAYRAPLPCAARTYEVNGLALAPGQLRLSFAQLEEAMASATELAYHEAPAAGALQKRLLERSRTLYRADNLAAPLAPGQLESLALPFEQQQLAFTPEHLELIFGARVDEPMLREGGYVRVEGEAGWWIPSGRIFLSPREADGAAEELAFAREHFFLPLRFRDPFGQTTAVTYDGYDLLPLETRDPLGNRVTAGERGGEGGVRPRISYRVLQPELTTDPNGNRTAVAFDIPGLVAGTAVMGKEGESVGDSLASFQARPSPARLDAFFADPRGPLAAELLGEATSRVVYDEGRFRRLGQPVWAASIARETHAADLGEGETSALQVSLAYSDGFGRVIQTKVQAEPGPLLPDGPVLERRWTTSGWRIFNNKGKPVRQYEPFFSAGHGFESGTAAGVSPTLCYDPLGRVVAILHPNHSWEKVSFDPWRQERWDVNDTVLVEDPASDPDVGDLLRRLPAEDYLPTWHQARIGGAMGAGEQDAARKAAAHASTPAVVSFDALGRAFLSIADNGPAGRHATRSEQNIEGAPLRIVDDRGNLVMAYQLVSDAGQVVPGYDVAGRQLYERGMDTGERRALPDIGGRPMRGWDSRGHTVRSTYDALRRPRQLFVRQGNGPELLAELTVYGEGHPEAEALNLRGRVYQVYDGAGVATSARFDMRGNPRESRRQLARAYQTTPDWSPLAGLEELAALEAAAAALLEDETFTTLTAYDALGRPVALTTPDGSVTTPRYSEASLLERIGARLRGAEQVTPFVSNIDYNARGQRERISYATADGTGVTTTFSYDPATFRLTRLHSVRQRDGRALQDLRYAYDPAGNLTSIRDEAQPAVFFANARVEAHGDYTYDALYRLILAEGREHSQHNLQRDSADVEPAIAGPSPNSTEALQRYVEEYVYDGVGNLLSVAHSGGGLPRWRRCYQYARDSNRLLGTGGAGELEARPCPEHYVQASALSQRYQYDTNGAMTAMPHLPLLRWDFKDQLQASSRQVVNAGTPETTYYVYNAAGERVRKVTERQAGEGQAPARADERIYLGGFELYRAYGGGGVTLERETLHMMDGQQRVAQIDTRTIGADGAPTRSQRYQLSNHLGSAVLELDEQANEISYEEYHPYGTTAYRAGRSAAEVSLKRYRYTDKERDEETGLAYHGARYYACWLARWTAADPLGVGDGLNRYAYVGNSPTTMVDPSGLARSGKHPYGNLPPPPDDKQPLPGVADNNGPLPGEGFEDYDARVNHDIFEPVPDAEAGEGADKGPGAPKTTAEYEAEEYARASAELDREEAQHYDRPMLWDMIPFTQIMDIPIDAGHAAAAFQMGDEDRFVRASARLAVDVIFTVIDLGLGLLSAPIKGLGRSAARLFAHGGGGATKATAKHLGALPDKPPPGHKGGIRQPSAEKRAEQARHDKALDDFTSGGGTVKTLPPASKIHCHHCLPQEGKLRAFFESKGLDIEQFRLRIPDEVHKEIHKGKAGGLWNETWHEFIKNNKHASPEEVLDKLEKMLDSFDLQKWKPFLPG